MLARVGSNRVRPRTAFFTAVAVCSLLPFASSICEGQSLFMSYDRITTDPGQLIQQLPRPNLQEVYSRFYNKPAAVDNVINAALDAELLRRGEIQTSTPESLRIQQRALFVQTERNYARAIATSALIGSVNKTTQTADDLAVEDFLAHLVQVRLIVQTGVAYEQYEKWKGSCHDYVPPPGYPGYNVDRDCDPPPGLLSLFWLGPFPPDTKNYGAIAAWGSPFPGAPQAVVGASLAMPAVTATLGAALGDTSLGTSLEAAITPYALTGAVTRALTLFSGPLAVVTLAVETLIEESIAVADASKREQRLWNAYSAAQSQLPDMKKFISSSNGLRQLLLAATETTIWTDATGGNPDGYPIPNANVPPININFLPWGAPRFGTWTQVEMVDWNGNTELVGIQGGLFWVFRPAGGVYLQASVPYKTWDGSNWTLQMTQSGAFFHTPQSGAPGHYDTMIKAIDSAGHFMTYWPQQLKGPIFADPLYFQITQITQGNKVTYSKEFRYRTWDDSAWEASYANGVFTNTNLSNYTVSTSAFFNYFSWDGIPGSAILDADMGGFSEKPLYGASHVPVGTFEAHVMDDQGRPEIVRLVLPGTGAQTWTSTAIGSIYGGPVIAQQSSVEEFSYVTCDGSQWYARFEGGHFVHRNAITDQEHSDTIIRYLGSDKQCYVAAPMDIAGSPGTAYLGGNFGITQVATGARSQSPTLNIVDQDGVIYSVNVKLPVAGQ